MLTKIKSPKSKGNSRHKTDSPAQGSKASRQNTPQDQFQEQSQEPLQAESNQRYAKKPADRPDSRPNLQDNRADNRDRLGNRLGNRPDNRADSRPGNRLDNRPGNRPDLRQAESNQRYAKKPPVARNVPPQLILEPKLTSLVPKAIEGFQPLFTPLTPFGQKCMQNLPAALGQVMYLKAPHRAALPQAIRELSQHLTSERGELTHSYWSAAKYVSAYLYYFLPWNLLRLARLLPNLHLPVPKDPLVVDLGSGPLTLPLALWLFRPDWREAPVHLICADTIPRPMQLGRSLLEAVAKHSQTPLNWKIELRRTPYLHVFRELPKAPDLIMAGNVLNEKASDLDDRMDTLASQIKRMANTGSALFMEPGTRLGGSLISSLRRAAIEQDLHPLAPCGHTAPCPMHQKARGWCHFNQDAGGPLWLARSAKDAGLPKDSLSLSFVHLCHTNTTQPLLQKQLHAQMQAQAQIEDQLHAQTYGQASGQTSGQASGQSATEDYPEEFGQDQRTSSIMQAQRMQAQRDQVQRDQAQNTKQDQATQAQRTLQASTTQPTPATAPWVGRIISDAFSLPGQSLARYACTSQGLGLVLQASSLSFGSVVKCHPVMVNGQKQKDAKSGGWLLRWE